jgi:hypothetical protein
VSVSLACCVSRSADANHTTRRVPGSRAPISLTFKLGRLTSRRRRRACVFASIDRKVAAARSAVSLAVSPCAPPLSCALPAESELRKCLGATNDRDKVWRRRADREPPADHGDDSRGGGAAACAPPARVKRAPSTLSLDPACSSVPLPRSPAPCSHHSLLARRLHATRLQ